MIRSISFLGLAATLLAATAGAPAASSDPPAGSWEDYRLIVSRNIFSRSRSVPSAPRQYTFSPPTAPRPAIQDDLLLVGIAVQDDARVAFFEDSRSGRTLRVPVGGALGAGTVEAISLNSVEYRLGGSTRRILIGQTQTGLTGPAVLSSAEPAPSDPAASGPAGPTGQAPSAGDGDILERMRRRRLEETKP